MITKAASSFILIFSVTFGLFAENKMLDPIKLEVDDPLTKETWEKNWKRSMGFWKWEGDSIKGIEDPSQNHAAGAGRIVRMDSAIVEFQFRLDKSNGIAFGTDFMKPKERMDHLLRIRINQAGYSVHAGKGWGKTTTMKPAGKKVAVKLDPNKWQKMRVEFHKQEIVVHLNDKFSFYGTAQINQDTPKNRIALIAKGKASFRNVKVWPGKLKEDWQKTKKSLAKK